MDNLNQRLKAHEFADALAVFNSADEESRQAMLGALEPVTVRWVFRALMHLVPTVETAKKRVCHPSRPRRSNTQRAHGRL